MEFQAIILAAGRGTRMTELTSHVAKCLLPIGNKPMIWYPIRMFEKAGFAEINIVTLKSLESKLETELKVNCGIRTKLNFVYVNDDDEENFDEGTASVLSLLKDKISKDCMIVSCDLIANVSIQLMANFYRAKNASFVMLLADTSEQNIELSIPGQKGKYSPGFFLKFFNSLVKVKDPRTFIV
jgi:translation initiation factor eIF-2B subunit gamma